VAADLSGCTALITGAASGIGRASALAFASAGASVALVDIDAEGLANTAAATRAAGGRAEALVADVRDLQAVTSAIERAVQAFGRLDAAHNNAGVPGPYVPLDEYGEQEFMEILQVDLELGGTGIRVNAIAPGVTRTAMTSAVSDELLRAVPLGRVAEPEEIAAAAVWLCSPEASYITGSVLVADGGWLAG